MSPMPPPDQQKVQLFVSQDGKAQLEVALEQETVWLSQVQMAELFGKDVRTVNEHVGNVFQEGELEKEPTIRKFRIVRQEGKRQVQRDIDHYNLDMIISVGYRVKSQRGVQFRKWATQVLKDHLVQGYTLVALALLVAESLPDQKTLMIRLIEHFLLLKEPADGRGEGE